MKINPLVIALAMTAFVSPAFAGYGAIAYSQGSNAYGQSWNFQTRWEAEERAMSECSYRGYGCKVVMWFRNACGALALAPGGGYGAAWGNSKYVAQQKAMNACYGDNQSCDLEISFCTD